MGDLHSQNPDNSLQNQNGISQEHRSSAEEDNDPAPPLSDLDAASPSPISRTILTVLDASLEQAPADTAAHLRQHALEQLGREIRRWRLQQGYSRALLAATLQLDANQLLCIEIGIAKTSDATVAQLNRLCDFLTEQDHDHRLIGMIRNFLAG